MKLKIGILLYKKNKNPMESFNVRIKKLRKYNRDV